MKILLVEDEPFMQEAMSNVIERTGVEVLRTDNIKAAKEILQTAPIDLLITDLYLPQPDGYELISYVKTNSVTANIPIIVITGFDSESSTNVGVVHADIFLKKPFTLEELRKAINKLSVADAAATD